MSLREEIKPYIDGNGLVAPRLADAKYQRSSDNGVLFTSEYLLQLYPPGTDINKVEDEQIGALCACEGPDGELHRAPGDTTPDEIDDHIGMLAFLAIAGKGPNFKLPFRLWRFPQLVYAYSLLRPSSIPKILSPFTCVLTAIIIAISGINTPLSDCDARILNWLLIQATKESLLCRMGAKIWWSRSKKQYGVTENVMQEVVKRYFEPEHPLIKYWKDYE